MSDVASSAGGGKKSKARSVGVKPMGDIPEIKKLTGEIEAMLQEFLDAEGMDSMLSTKERVRLQGAGIKKYGFIDKAWDIARENPALMPPYFSLPEMEDAIKSLEALRQLSWVIEQLDHAVQDAMFIEANIAYKQALLVYGYLKEMAKRGVPGAEELYKALVAYFHRKRNADPNDPTIKQLEHDFSRLIHGHADGKLEVINEQPHITAGVHTVVDDVHTGHSDLSESARLDINDNTSKK